MAHKNYFKIYTEEIWPLIDKIERETQFQKIEDIIAAKFFIRLQRIRSELREKPTKAQLRHCAKDIWSGCKQIYDLLKKDKLEIYEYLKELSQKLDNILTTDIYSKKFSKIPKPKPESRPVANPIKKPNNPKEEKPPVENGEDRNKGFMGITEGLLTCKCGFQSENVSEGLYHDHEPLPNWFLREIYQCKKCGNIKTFSVEEANRRKIVRDSFFKRLFFSIFSRRYSEAKEHRDAIMFQEFLHNAPPEFSVICVNDGSKMHTIKITKLHPYERYISNAFCPVCKSKNLDYNITKQWIT